MKTVGVFKMLLGLRLIDIGVLTAVYIWGFFFRMGPPPPSPLKAYERSLEDV